MAPDPRGSPAGMIFRRLDADGDRRRAARLLPGCALDDHDGTCAWYGLCDLTAAEATGLAAVARVRCAEPGTARLCGLAVSTAYDGPRVGRRLVREVADRMRASGIEELSAPPALDHGVVTVLAQVGFTVSEQPQERGRGWLRLPL
ncbi:GNAT family N-acetyltransferase [Geodermatophilus maliterrae]|uniref:GNAT family N-acetyltransferase n=1 Tax=Geodermatophilus maliterrae TaxID=3162531 RepID=A0ABV3X9B5_9ACTN